MSDKLYGLKLLAALNIDSIQCHLDELVVETLEASASTINNQGISAQIKHLLRAGFSEADIVSRLSDARGGAIGLQQDQIAAIASSACVNDLLPDDEVTMLQSDLDVLVVEAITSDGESINNSGFNDQVNHLHSRGFTDADIISRLVAASADTLTLIPELNESVVDGVKRVTGASSAEDVLRLLGLPVNDENMLLASS